MKQIVLKPILSINDVVNFSDAECIVDRIDSFNRCYILRDTKDGQKFKVYFYEIKDIIESPDEPVPADARAGKHIAEEMKEMQLIIQKQKEKICSLTNKVLQNLKSFFPCGHEPHCIKCNPVEEKDEPMDRVADAGKAIEEKPALKLSGNTYYKTDDGKTEKVFLDNPFDQYRSFPWKGESGRRYSDNGQVYAYSTGNLIEEVQPEQQKLKLKEFSCDECGANGVRISDNVSCPVCTKEKDYKQCECQCCPECIFRYEEKPTVAEKEAVECCGHDKSIYYGCFKCMQKISHIFQEENKELKSFLAKPQGNPFKVGERCFAYGRDISGKHEFSGAGSVYISEVNGKYLTVDAGFIRATLHYKQCERVG